MKKITKGGMRGGGQEGMRRREGKCERGQIKTEENGPSGNHSFFFIFAVVLGDFNESTSGLYKGKVCHWLENSCEISFRNAVLQHNSEPPHTWEWQLPIIKLRAHFDHIFYSKERLVCVAADVVPVYNASDHHPVVAQLAFPVPDSNT